MAFSKNNGKPRKFQLKNGKNQYKILITLKKHTLCKSPFFFFNKCFKKGIKFQCSKDGIFVKIKNMESYILLSFQHNFRSTNVKIDENHEKKMGNNFVDKLWNVKNGGRQMEFYNVLIIE
jgi:hypothetical protein